MFKENREKVQSQFFDESGHSDNMKIMKMDIKDFFK